MEEYFAELLSLMKKMDEIKAELQSVKAQLDDNIRRVYESGVAK